MIRRNDESAHSHLHAINIKYATQHRNELLNEAYYVEVGWELKIMSWVHTWPAPDFNVVH